MTLLEPPRTDENWMFLSKLVAGAILLLLAAGGAACTTTRAATPVDRPALEVPPPPPRLIEPPPALESPPPEPLTEPPATTPTGSSSRPRPQKDPGTAKPDAKPESPPETVPPIPAPPATAPQLRAPGLASSPEAAGEIRSILDRATGTLGRIDYHKLTKLQQTSYDTAKRFADEGEKELKGGNYVLAKELAEKADRLAKELQVR